MLYIATHAAPVTANIAPQLLTCWLTSITRFYSNRYRCQQLSWTHDESNPVFSVQRVCMWHEQAPAWEVPQFQPPRSKHSTLDRKDTSLLQKNNQLWRESRRRAGGERNHSNAQSILRRWVKGDGRGLRGSPPLNTLHTCPSHCICMCSVGMCNEPAECINCGMMFSLLSIPKLAGVMQRSVKLLLSPAVWLDLAIVHSLLRPSLKSGSDA